MFIGHLRIAPGWPFWESHGQIPGAPVIISHEGSQQVQELSPGQWGRAYGHRYGHAYWFPFVLLKCLKSNSYFLFKITCVVLLFSSLFILQTDVIGDIQGVSQNQQNNGLWEVDVNSIGSENCCNWQWLAWEQLTSIVFGRIRFGLDTSGQEVVGGKNIWAGKKLSHISSSWSNIIWPNNISVKYARSNLFLVLYDMTK